MVPGFPWFGPKKFGWGWTPVSWQGWAVTALFMVCVLGAAYGPRLNHRLAVILGMSAVFIGLVAATGTKPGGSWH